ncbi:hypothetical protein BCR43DRAFT_519485 [Syncephalastrum racemosum]|uniref:Uncharacterized protein n=1 Tax=Syncephalastrum racemosum TaxID=13706 RepID=A0A1X2GYZ0_SYNRA|nr:hypothetical protein BCR43DRAFT_519485 [Syncephalastrum racemosum]
MSRVRQPEEFGPRNTSTQRSARANQALNAAKAPIEASYSRPRPQYASAYTRFTRAIKGLIFQMLPKYQSTICTDNPVPLSFLVADREADAQVNNDEKAVADKLGLMHEEEKVTKSSARSSGTSFTIHTSRDFVGAKRSHNQKGPTCQKKASQEKRERGSSSRSLNTQMIQMSPNRAVTRAHRKIFPWT